MYHVPYTIYLCIILVPIYFYDLLSILALHLSLKVCRFPLPRSLSLSFSLCRFLCFVWFCLLPQRASKIAAQNVNKSAKFSDQQQLRASCEQIFQMLRQRQSKLSPPHTHSLTCSECACVSLSLSLARTAYTHILAASGSDFPVLFSIYFCLA